MGERECGPVMEGEVDAEAEGDKGEEDGAARDDGEKEAVLLDGLLFDEFDRFFRGFLASGAFEKVEILLGDIFYLFGVLVTHFMGN